MLAKEGWLAVELRRGRGSRESEGVLLLQLVRGWNGPLQVGVRGEDDL